jgi:hypothetical protein
MLQVRPEQMAVFTSIAEANFAQRLAAHLRAQYAETVVHLPDSSPTVKELQDETLHLLIIEGIKRGRNHGLSYENAVAAFIAIMFEVAPNFDIHSLVEPFLKDESIAPNSRLDPLLNQLTKQDWETVRSAYDVNAWRQIEEDAEG